jgi:hypothetical protein
MEDFLWKFFGESLAVQTTKGDHYHIQDLAPELADFLHERGVDVDWTDRSRYG